MVLQENLEGLLQNYGELRVTRRIFDKDRGPENIAARNRIIGPTGDPFFGEAGLAHNQLAENEAENLQEVSEDIRDAETYATFKEDVEYDSLDDEKKSAAYINLLDSSEKVRGSLQGEAIKRVAAEARLEQELSAEDADWDNRSDAEKIAAYLGKIQGDEELQGKLGEDKAMYLASVVDTYSGLVKLLDKGKLDEAIMFANERLGANMASLWRSHGYEANAKATLMKVALKQKKKAEKLIKENESLLGDVENSLERVENGYARAAGEVYAVKE